MYCLASIRQNCVFDINHRDQKYSSVTTACFKKHFCKRKIRPKSHYLCMWSKGWQWHPSFYAMFRPFLALNAFRGKQHNPQFDPPIYFIILFWCILRNYLRLNSPLAVYSFIEDIFYLDQTDVIKVPTKQPRLISSLKLPLIWQQKHHKEYKIKN